MLNRKPRPTFSFGAPSKPVALAAAEPVAYGFALAVWSEGVTILGGGVGGAEGASRAFACEKLGIQGLVPAILGKGLKVP